MTRQAYKKMGLAASDRVLDVLLRIKAGRLKMRVGEISANFHKREYVSKAIKEFGKNRHFKTANYSSLVRGELTIESHIGNTAGCGQIGYAYFVERKRAE